MKKNHSTKPITVELFKKRLRDVHGDEVVLVEETYCGYKKQAQFIDKKYGIFWTTPTSVYEQGSRHTAHKIASLKPQKPLGLAEVLSRIPRHISLDVSTYTFTEQKARFIDDVYGEFWAIPKHVFSGKANHYKRRSENRKNTFIKKTGYPHALCNPVTAQKAMRSSNKSYIERHWKTGQELVCTGSYELAVVLFLNQKQIFFEWQPKSFQTSLGTHYIPDLYLPDQDLWVEIKGYMRPHSKVKWDWFHAEHPNSELWNLSKLKELRIL